MRSCLAVRDERLTTRVGAITLACLAALAGFQIASDGCDFTERFPVTVYYAHLGGLSEGDAVQVAGRQIGHISAISSVPTRADGPAHPLMPEGGVAVHLLIDVDRRHMTALNAEPFIATKGLFGQKYIELGPPAGGAERQRPLRAGDEIRGVDRAKADRVFIRSYRNMQIAREFMDAIRPEWDELTRALGQLGLTLTRFEVMPAAVAAGESIGRLTGEARALRATIAATGVTRADIARLLDDARATAERMNATIAEVRARLRVLEMEFTRLRARIPDDSLARFRGALTAADQSLARVDHLVASAREIASIIRRGEGTVGAIWNDPEFPEYAKDLGKLIKRHPWELIGRPRPNGRPTRRPTRRSTQPGKRKP